MKSSERGAALLVVLMMVAGMSAVAVGVLDSMRRSQRLWSNAATQAQAQWHALGADAYARVVAADLQDDQARYAFLAGDQTAAFPLDDGMMALRVRDGGACFNLNSVVEGAGDIYQRNESGAAQLRTLMTAINIPDRQASELVNDLVAWIDTGGGDTPDRDDTPYLNRQPPYLTGAQPLAEVSELRAIRGFTPEIVARLRPYVCALPEAGLTKLNVNALTPEHAPLLTAITEGAINVSVARNVIEARPKQGWPNAAAFWTSPRLATIQPPESALSQIAIQPTYMELIVDVTHGDATATLTQLMRRNGSRLTTTSRRWNVDP